MLIVALSRPSFRANRQVAEPNRSPASSHLHPELLVVCWLEAGRLFEDIQESSRAIDSVTLRIAYPFYDTRTFWPGWYSLRRFHGTAVRAESNLETTSRALGNSKAVADKHYVKPAEVLPDVRKAVNGAVSGLTVVQLRRRWGLATI